MQMHPPSTLGALVIAALISTNAGLLAQSVTESGGIAMIQAEQSPQVQARAIGAVSLLI